MPLTAPDSPIAPDLNQPDSYNARVLAGFQWAFETLPNWIAGLDAEDWFDVQTSMHDTTMGRVLKAGAYGWGQYGNHQASVLLNSIQSSGVHQFSNSDPDKPGSTGGAVLVIRYSHQWMTQIAFGPNTNDMWLRRTQDDGVTWTAWVPVVPERGSNANGEYVRFPDGTQICTHNMPLSYHSTWLLLATWTYPAQFIAAADSVMGSVGAHSVATSVTPDRTEIGAVQFDNSAAGSVRVDLFRNEGATNFVSGDEALVWLTAIGRWY